MLRMAPLISFIVLLMLSSVAHATRSERLYYASKGGYLQAAAAGHFKIAQTLLRQGASSKSKTIGGWAPFSARAHEGKTIFDLATLAHQDSMVRFLKKYARRKGKRIPRTRKPVAAAITQVQSGPRPISSKSKSPGLKILGIDINAAAALLGV